jgi:hypothetical protein
MKRKSILISVIIVIIIIAFIYFKYIFGWLEFRSNNYTSKEYKSIVNVSKKQYSKDSLSLVSIIRDKIKNHQHPYYNSIRVNEKSEYINDSLTKIYIDSIFYNPDLSKLVFLVIVENENLKLYKGVSKDEAYSWEKSGNLPYEGTHFNGNSFIAKRNRESEIVIISSFSRNSFTNSRTYEESSIALMNDCLNHRENNNKATYNVDDKRFWDSDVWSSDK